MKPGKNHVTAMLIVALLALTASAAAAASKDYTLYDEHPSCLADEMCPEGTHYSTPEERMMLTKINSLRFDPTLHIMRNDHLDDDTVCELARTSGKVANVHPLFWRSDLAQAAKFHAWSMATSTHPCLQKNTCPHHCALFDGDCAAATRVAYFHEAATNPRGVATIVGEGSPDDVLNAWIRSEDACAVVFSRRHDTIGVGMWTADDGRLFWSLVLSDAQPEQTNHRLSLTAGSHVPTDDHEQIKFLVHYYDRALGEGLREFAAVVDGNYHHLRRVLGDTAQSSEVGRTGLFEDTVPVKRDDHDCHYYYFQFRTGASGRPIRLPEVGVYWTTGVAGCQLVYSNENPSSHPTLEFIKPEDDVHEHHRPGYKEPKTFWQAYGLLMTVIVAAGIAWRLRRRINVLLVSVAARLGLGDNRQGPTRWP